VGGPVLMYKLYRIYFLVVHTITVHSIHPLFLTKHSIMAPLIWRLIGLVNLSESVAETSEDISVVYLQMYMYTYALFQKT
jgi:hypothetical protein